MKYSYGTITQTFKMMDKDGQHVNIGDAVRYWHKVDGHPIPEIGEIVAIDPFRQSVTIDRKFYNGTNHSFRRASGITKLSKSDAVLWKLEEMIPTEIA